MGPLRLSQKQDGGLLPVPRFRFVANDQRLAFWYDSSRANSIRRNEPSGRSRQSRLRRPRAGFLVIQAVFCSIARWVLDQDRSDLDAFERALIFALADYADANGLAFPSVDSLMKKVNASRSTIYSRLEKLEEKGVIEIVGRRDSSYRTNRYRLLVGTAPIDTCPEGRHEGPITKPTYIGTSSPPGRQPRSSYSQYPDVWGELKATAEGKPDLVQPVEEFHDLSVRLAFRLADGLIETGQKDARYRDDAISLEWQYSMKKLLFDLADSVMDLSFEEKSRVFEAAIDLALEREDFSHASWQIPPPKMLERSWQALLVDAERQVIAQPVPRVPELSPTIEKQPDLDQRPPGFEGLPAPPSGDSRKGSSPRSPFHRDRSRGDHWSNTPKGREQNAAFQAEVERILGGETGAG